MDRTIRVKNIMVKFRVELGVIEAALHEVKRGKVVMLRNGGWKKNSRGDVAVVICECGNLIFEVGEEKALTVMCDSIVPSADGNHIHRISNGFIKNGGKHGVAA